MSAQGPLLNHLDEIEARFKDKDPTLQQIVDVFGADGHFVLILFLVLPFLQPIPLVGLSTPFGLIIAVVSFWHYRRQPPVIPQRWAFKTISKNTVLKIAEGSEKIFRKFSGFIQPRWPVFLKRPFRELNSLLLIINAVLLALPLPIPFSNTIPSWMIFFQALGHLENDGVMIAISYILNMGCWIYFALIALGFEKGLSLSF